MWRPIDCAAQYIGTREIGGSRHNPVVVAMLSRTHSWAVRDEIPWCSAFVDWCLWNTGHQTTGRLNARSFITCGVPIWRAEDGKVGMTNGHWSVPENKPEVGDIVVISRTGHAPGPEVQNAPGHVYFFSHFDGDRIVGIGGNQNNMVNLSGYHEGRLLAINRPAVSANFYEPGR